MPDVIPPSVPKGFTGFKRCQTCCRRPVVEPAGEAWAIRCHGYLVVRPDLERAKRVWNAEQAMVREYGALIRKERIVTKRKEKI